MKTRLTAIISIIVIISITSLVFHATQSFYKDSVRGLSYFEEDHFAQARPFLEKATAIKPADRKVLTALLETYDRLDMPEEKQTLLEQGLQHHPNNRTYLREMGDVSYHIGDHGSAEKAYMTLLKLEPSFYAREKLAEVLVWQKKYAKAIELLEVIVEENPDNTKNNHLLADVYMWSKEHEKAIKAYKRVLELDPELSDAALKLAETLRYAGRNEEAIAIYEQYLNNK